MKSYFIILFCLISVTVLSQKKVVKKFETKAREIEIATLGVDDLVIENSETDFIEIYLVAEDIAEQHILYKEVYNLVRIQFEIPEKISEEQIFRKFITERLQRASAVIKVPKNKKITVFGDEINVEFKSYKGDVEVFIEKGILKLHTIYSNLLVKMYSGNLHAALNKTNISVVSKKGKIKIDTIFVQKKYQKKVMESKNEVLINTQKANIFLTTQ